MAVRYVGGQAQVEIGDGDSEQTAIIEPGETTLCIAWSAGQDEDLARATCYIAGVVHSALCIVCLKSPRPIALHGRLNQVLEPASHNCRSSRRVQV